MRESSHAFMLRCLLACGLATGALASESVSTAADGRMPLPELLGTIDKSLASGWEKQMLYSYPAQPEAQIVAWHTQHKGPALWLIAGIHGEEPAGPNAIAREIDAIKRLAADGVPIVLIPMANPNAYRNNWRYPNTAERDWRKGGYSVGDSEYLLPALDGSGQARAASVAGPETEALTQFVLRTSRDYPPLLVLDLHEDELSVDGGYIYSQGVQADANPVGAEIIRALQSSGIALRLDGQTRFGEPIAAGVISRDDKGNPIRDGSIDELLASDTIIRDGRMQPGPAGRTVIVVETPADASVSLEQRVAGQREVLRRLPALWQMHQESFERVEVSE